MIIGIVLGLLVHDQAVNRHAKGREQYLADQAVWYDHHYMNVPSTGIALVASIACVVVTAGVYELLAAGIGVILKQCSNAGPSSENQRFQSKP